MLGDENRARESADVDIGTGLVRGLWAATPVGVRQGNGRWLDRQTAEHYYDRAGGDPDAARVMAAKDGWQIRED